MAEAVTPNTVHLTSWFTEYQKNHIVKDGVTPKWFHGIISRKQAEEMLMTKPPGYFLIRVSESRIGYTLSYRTEDLCRHFMIEMLPGNQCEIVGENVRHCSLYDLVDFHHRTPIRPYNELLTVACDQIDKNISEDIPPALPARHWLSHPPIPNQNLSISSDVSVSPPRLYPSLEHELRSLSLDSVGSPLNPAPQSRPKFILTLPELTTKWCSAHAKATTGEEQTTGLPTACNQRKSKDKVPQKSLAELKFTRININQCKKIFKKKKNHSEEHTYMEINESEVTTEPAALQIDENRDHQEVHGVSGTIPLEYLNPPPFAPGY